MPESVSLASLWLPIVLSAVAVFIASSIVWMVLPHHKQDWGKVPDEEGVMKALREVGVKPGQYAFPNCGGDMKLMGTPEFVEKMNAGPVAMLVVGPNGPPAMGKLLGQWFVYTLVLSALVGYLGTLVFGAGASFGDVFRVTSTAAFLGYCGALVPAAIWKSHSWVMIGKETLDGLAYAFLTAAIFGGLWPGLG